MSTFNKYRLKGAYHYDWYRDYSWYRKLIDRAIRFCKGPTLEVGSGEGLLVSKLMNNVPVTAIDNDEYAVKLASDNGVNVRLQDAQDAFGGEWEYLVCLNTIEHLDRPEAIKRIIKQNITKGAIISTIDYQGGSLGEDHKREYTMDELVEFFKEFNPKPFRIEDIWIGVEIEL